MPQGACQGAAHAPVGLHCLGSFVGHVVWASGTQRKLVGQSESQWQSLGFHSQLPDAASSIFEQKNPVGQSASSAQQSARAGEFDATKPARHAMNATVN